MSFKIYLNGSNIAISKDVRGVQGMVLSAVSFASVADGVAWLRVHPAAHLDDVFGYAIRRYLRRHTEMSVAPYALDTMLADDIVAVSVEAPVPVEDATAPVEDMALPVAELVPEVIEDVLPSAPVVIPVTVFEPMMITVTHTEPDPVPVEPVRPTPSPYMMPVDITSASTGTRVQERRIRKYQSPRPTTAPVIPELYEDYYDDAPKQVKTKERADQYRWSARYKI